MDFWPPLIRSQNIKNMTNRTLERVLWRLELSDILSLVPYVSFGGFIWFCRFRFIGLIWSLVYFVYYSCFWFALFLLSGLLGCDSLVWTFCWMTGLFNINANTSTKADLEFSIVLLELLSCCWRQESHKDVTIILLTALTGLRQSGQHQRASTRQYPLVLTGTRPPSSNRQYFLISVKGMVVHDGDHPLYLSCTLSGGTLYLSGRGGLYGLV